MSIGTATTITYPDSHSGEDTARGVVDSCNGRTIVLVYNTARYMLNLRGSLISSLLARGARVIAIAPRDEAFAGLESLGVETRDWNLSAHGMNPLADFASYRRLKRLLAEIAPDIVLNFTIKPVIYGSLAARDVCGNRVFSMVPGRGYLFGERALRQRFIRRLVSPLYRRALRCNHRVFFQNPQDRDHFVEQRLIAPDQGVVIDGSGVDVDHYRPQPHGTVPGSFLLVARLLEEKGIVEYAAAARILKSRYPHARFQLLGPFSDAPSALRPEVVRGWHSEGILEYLGETEDVRPYMAGCMVFVLPSYYQEGLPRTALEALAMGKPVITTDWPGCREAVCHSRNGVLVPVQDVGALVRAMERFIEDPSLAGDMGAESRNYACARFDVRRVNEVVIEHLIT